MEPIPEDELPPIITIRTRQRDRMVAFYRDGLGLSPISEPTDNLVALGGFGIHLFIDAQDGVPSIHGKTDFVSDLGQQSFVKLSEYLSNRGVTNNLLGSQIDFVDPDGHRMIIRQIG